MAIRRRTKAPGQTITAPGGRAVTLPSKWASRDIGFAVGGAFAPRPAHNLRYCFHSLVGEGKTEFCCSAPRCLILDIEKKSDSVPRLGEGSVRIHEGSVEAYWKVVTEVIEDVEADREAGREPVFNMIAIDPLDSWVDRVRDDMTLQLKGNPKYRESMGPFPDVTKFGQQGNGWDFVIQDVRRLLDLISGRGGMGTIVTAHRYWKILTDAQNQNSKVPQSSLTPAILRTVNDCCDYMGVLARETVSVPTQVQRKIGGKMQTITKNEQQSVFAMLFEESRYMPCRQAIPIPGGRIILPDGYGWEAWEAAYAGACAERAGTLGSLDGSAPEVPVDAEPLTEDE